MAGGHNLFAAPIPSSYSSSLIDPSLAIITTHTVLYSYTYSATSCLLSLFVMWHRVGDALDVATGGLFCCCVSMQRCSQLTVRPPTYHSPIPPMHPHKYIPPTTPPSTKKYLCSQRYNTTFSRTSRATLQGAELDR